MGYLSRGRHRQKSKSKSKVVASALVVGVLPLTIAFGYYEISTHEDYPVAAVNAYANAPSVPTTTPSQPQAEPSLAVAAPSLTAPRITVHRAPDPPAPVTTSQRPTQGATGSPVEKDQEPPTQPHQTQDQKAPAKTSEPPPPKIKASAKCANLEAKGNVVRACNALMAQFPTISAMGGLGNRPENPTSCHPLGEALDVMVGNNSLGDSINAWAHEHRAEYEIAYIGWEVPDHWDHVHLSFKPCKG